MELKTSQKKIAVAAAVPALLVLVTLLFGASHESTDNAYIAAHVATLSPKVAGIVTEVLVEENYKVKKDQILVRIDQRDYKNALDTLRAELGAVEASLLLAEKDNKRSVKLFSEQVVTEQTRDRDRTKFKELENKRIGLQAQIAQAELNMSFAEIRAPSDGTIGKKLVEPGMVVSLGQPLLSFVDSHAPWVVANFKETQFKKLRIGQKAEVEIDAIGGKTFEGEIESFAPGTGATFALIPPDNATGNFTKIVQRVPVRIRFTEESLKGFEDRIVPGLSAEVKVYIAPVEVHAAPSPQTATSLSAK